MAERSNMLVFALGLGAMFSILYVSSIFSEQGHAHHFDDIPTEAKIPQLEAIEIIENDLRAKIPQLQEVNPTHNYYNFSLQKYESDQEYVRYIINKVGYGYSFDHIKQHPELLQLPLRFVHFNGTIYDIDSSTNSFDKICDEPSLTCPMGKFGGAARDRLVYNAEIRWQPPTEEIWYNEGFYIIDAESGKIVWNSIDYEKNRKPMPNVTYGNRTIRQLFEERLDPPVIMHVDIERGASLATNEVGFLPKDTRVTLGIDNKIQWTNRDLVTRTVVSDNSYSNDYTGRFESELIEPNSSFEYTFFATGRYPYHYDIHPWMTGTVEVLEEFS